jgi:hypothetical protein
MVTGIVDEKGVRPLFSVCATGQPIDHTGQKFDIGAAIRYPCYNRA